LGVPAVSLMTAMPETMADRDDASGRYSLEAQRILDAATAEIKSAFGVDFNHNHSYSMYAPYTVICSSRCWHSGHEEFTQNQFHYWGALVSERKGAPAAQGSKAVERLLTDKRLGQKGHPLFLCSLGTVTTGSAFAMFGSTVQDYYRKLCKAAALLPDVTFIFAVGKAAEIKEEGEEEKRVSELFGEPVPANVTVARTVEQPKVLARANGFLTHCGQNSSSEVLSAGVPVVMAPFFGDQIANALRFEEFGCGLAQAFYADLKSISDFFPTPDPSLVKPEDLAEAMRTVLDKPSFEAAMRRLRAQHEAEVNQQTIAEKIQSLADYADEQAKGARPCISAWPHSSNYWLAGA